MPPASSVYPICRSAQAATVWDVLHIDRQVNALASWGIAGWQHLVEDGPFRAPLWYALTELVAAADAEDQEAVEEFAPAVGALLHPIAAAGDPALVSIAMELWGDLQYAVGRRSWLEVALAGASLRVAAGPAPTGPRPVNAVPAYLPVERRLLSGGAVPLTELTASRPLPTNPGLAFLMLLPEALNTSVAHLVDPETAQAPRGATAARVGWAAGQPGPDSLLIGSLLPAGRAVLAIDPKAATAAVNVALANAGDQMHLVVGQVAAALASARAMDTTLTITTAEVTRRAGVHASVMDGGPDRWHWQIGIATWHQRQFYARQPTSADAARGLRLVRDSTPE